MNDISLSAAAWQTAAQAHAALAAALRFPAYYGGNLDALFDCLRDLDETAEGWHVADTFTPQMPLSQREEMLQGWNRAVKGAIAWAKE